MVSSPQQRSAALGLVGGGGVVLVDLVARLLRAVAAVGAAGRADLVQDDAGKVVEVEPRGLEHCTPIHSHL